MPDRAPATQAIPSTLACYAAYLQARVMLTPQISMADGKAVITIGDVAVLSLTFTRRNDHWTIRVIEVSRGAATVAYASSELARAIADLTGREPHAAIRPVSGLPRRHDRVCPQPPRALVARH